MREVVICRWYDDIVGYWVSQYEVKVCSMMWVALSELFGVKQADLLISASHDIKSLTRGKKTQHTGYIRLNPSYEDRRMY